MFKQALTLAAVGALLAAVLYAPGIPGVALACLALAAFIGQRRS